MPVHHMIALTWPAVRALASDRLIAILPLGAIEAHGPHLPLGTDIVIAMAMAEGGAEVLSQRGLDVLLLPPLPVGPAPFARSFAGTIDSPAAATTMQIAAIARSLQQHGIRATAIANAHHDPTHVAAIRAAVEDVSRTRDGHLVFPELTRRRLAQRIGGEFATGACHAGRYEGSIVLAREPEWVDAERMRGLPANPSSLTEAIRRGDDSFEQAGGPDAYFGWPADATAAEGEQLIATLGAVLAEAVVEALESSPAHRDAPIKSHPNVMPLQIIHPAERARPRGFSHGVLAPAGTRALYVAGQTAADDQGVVTDVAFTAQFENALRKVLDVVRTAGGDATHIARMTVYVTDVEMYRVSRGPIGDAWRRHMGTHYPAMALIGVSALVDRGAQVEIEATAILPAPEGQ
jgi:creatinine amidohydrolase